MGSKLASSDYRFEGDDDTRLSNISAKSNSINGEDDSHHSKEIVNEGVHLEPARLQRQLRGFHIAMIGFR